MNNGRMTFRFDIEKDKLKSKAEDSWSGGGLGTAKEYTGRSLPQEAEPSLHDWSYDREIIPDGDRGPELEWVLEPEEEPGERGQAGSLPFIAGETERYSDRSLSGNGYGGSYHTRRPSYWWKFALSVAGAVGTGLFLGYAALSLFGGGAAEEGTGSAVVTVDTAAVQQETAGAADPAGTGTSGLPIGGTGKASTGNASTNGLPVQVAAQSYYLLQYGVFSTPAGAAQAQQELLDAGLAAGLDPADGNRVYAGMSPEREQAKLLSSGLKDQGIELYVREVALPAAERLVFAGEAEAVNRYFAVSGKLLGELSGRSASLLSAAGQVDGAAGISAVSDLHLEWSEDMKALEQGLSPEVQSICAELEKSLSQGIAALSEYNKNKSHALLWEVQESMLSFLNAQKRLLSAMA